MEYEDAILVLYQVKKAIMWTGNFNYVMYHFYEMLMYTLKRNKEMTQGRINMKVVLVAGILLMMIALVLQPFRIV
jgi:hypothetical protein